MWVWVWVHAYVYMCVVCVCVGVYVCMCVCMFVCRRIKQEVTCNCDVVSTYCVSLNKSLSFYFCREILHQCLNKVGV